MSKVYLSPSDQYSNTYAYGDTNEGVQCHRIAEACKAALERSGVTVILGATGSMYDRVAASNAAGVALHVPIHTNAFNAHVMGTRIFYYSSTSKGFGAAKCIYGALAPISPGSSDNMATAIYYEIKDTTAPAVYVECEFHDTQEGAKWIVENVVLIGETIARGICEYLGVAYVEPPATPEPDGKGPYHVQLGSFESRENAEAFLKTLQSAFIKEG